MRQIDQMTSEEVHTLKLKGMLPTTIKPLHPTFKACKCGHIGTKSQFYRHMDEWKKVLTNAKDFYAAHGEIPLNIDDPRVTLSAALALTLEQHERKQKALESI